ncbi:MAG: YibE/F family protein [Clostridia bacterium]|nr:YibE/F family protein [Clostridia bacterium]
MDKKKMMTFIAIFIVAVSGFIFWKMVENTGTEEPVDLNSVPYSRGKVIEVLTEQNRQTTYSGGSFEFHVQIVKTHIIKGPHKGETLLAEYELNYGLDDQYKFIQLDEGDEVLLYLEEDENGEVIHAAVAEIARDKYLFYLVIGFFAMLLLVGRMKGLKAILSLLLTAIGVVKILLPAILKGMDPVFISVGVCVIVICSTMLIISGFNKKSLSAMIGTSGGVVCAGIIAMVIGTLAKLTGFGDQEAQMLMYIPQNIAFDFKGLLFAGIIIGTMGATMDVGMSIASAMHEIKENSPNIKHLDLIKAGMNVGRDTMATMANTLILAYAGGSLHLMLLLVAYQTPFSEVVNWDAISTEILRAVAGSIGIVATVPITAFVAGMIEEYKDKGNKAIG